MIRVHIREAHDECTLLVEGTIESADAVELEACWQGVACAGKKTVVLDVSSVLRVDRQARVLLGRMYRGGVKFVGARLAIADTMEQIVSSAANISQKD